MATKKKLTFEQQLTQAEALVAEIESGGLGLEEAMTKYEEGLKLLKELDVALGNAKQRLEVLRKAQDGTEQLELMEDKE